MRYFSEDYFKELERQLSLDLRWQENTRDIKTSILLSATDQGASYLLTVENGRTSIAKSEPGTQAEFSFEGSYEAWSKVGRGEQDLQSAVLKGALKFRGSITKILLYKDRFLRIADIMKTVPKEF